MPDSFNIAAMTAGGMDADLVEKITRAYEMVRDLIERDVPVSFAWSGGKDSSVALAIGVVAYRDVIKSGRRALPLIAVTADTAIENPVVHAYWRQMLEHLKQYAATNGLDIRVKVAKPNLAATWVVKVVSGCGLPTFANSKHRKCAIDLKREPANRVLRRLMPEIRKELEAILDAAPADFLRVQQLVDAAKENKAVVIVGTRFGESVERDKRMTARGDAADHIRPNEDGFLVLPLIADFTLEDVWEVLALSGQYEGAALEGFAPDFNATRDLYREATGECVIVAGEKAQGSACGARFGCALCTAVSTDKSMETMLQDPRYAFMEPLNRLRDFLADTQNDYSRRRWVGRGFHPVTGYVKLAPDGYSSAMCEELLGIMMTMDVREMERAERLAASARRYKAGLSVNWPDPYLRQCTAAGKIDIAYLERMVEPQFRLVNADELLMIDFTWGRYAVHRPFRALWLFREIYKRGKRYEIPTVDREAFKDAQYPAARWTWAPENPFRYNPLFDPLEWSLRDRPGADLPVVTDKTVSMDVNEAEGTYTVDDEGLYFILEYELDHLLAEYHDSGKFGPMAAVQYYLRVGTISVPKGRIQESGAVALRNLRLKEAGLDPALGPDELPMEGSLSQAEHDALVKSMADQAIEPSVAAVKPVLPARQIGPHQLDLFTEAA